MIPALKKAFDSMGDDGIEFSTVKETLKTKKDSHDRKALEESEVKLLEKFIDEKISNLIKARMEKEMKKQSVKSALCVLSTLLTRAKHSFVSFRLNEDYNTILMAFMPFEWLVRVLIIFGEVKVLIKIL